MSRVEVDIGCQRRVVVVNDARMEPTANSPVNFDTRLVLTVVRKICKMIASSTGVHRARVLEMFGGLGWHSAVIQDELRPRSHLVFELKDDCCESICRSFSIPRAVTVRQKDSHAYIRNCRRVFDWIHCDFSNFTWKQADTKQYSGVLENVFRCSARYVTITDSAIYGFRWPQNKRCYVDLIGMDPNADPILSYFESLNKVYQERYGFGFRRCFTWRHASGMYLLRRGYTGPYKQTKEMDLVNVSIKEPRG